MTKNEIPGETLEDALDITALLHGDDPELILLVDPDQEGLGLVVEDAAALGPVALHASNLQVGVAGHEEEVVVNELLAGLLVHAGQRVVATSEVAGQLAEGILHESLNVNALLLGDAGGEAESLDGAADTDPKIKNQDQAFMESRSLLIISAYLAEWTGTSELMLPVILEESMSEVCLKSAGRPWYSQMRGSKTSAKSM